jgi:hypothetical protein
MFLKSGKVIFPNPTLKVVFDVVVGNGASKVTSPNSVWRARYHNSCGQRHNNVFGKIN